MRPADSGYTLVELLIGLAIAAVLTGFLAVFVYQTLAVTNSGNDRLLVTDDLRAAGTWLTQDGQMADLGTSVAAEQYPGVELDRRLLGRQRRLPGHLRRGRN